MRVLRLLSGVFHSTKFIRGAGVETSDKIAAVSAAIAVGAIGIASYSLWSQQNIAALTSLPAVSVYDRYEVQFPESEGSPVTTTLNWKIENTGLGPAFVHSGIMQLPDGRTFPMHSDEAWEELKNQIRMKYGVGEPLFYDRDPPSCPYAISPGADWAAFSISYPSDLSSKLHEVLGIDFAICYCSLHGDCFVARSGEVEIACPDVEIDPETLLREENNSCGN